MFCFSSVVTLSVTVPLKEKHFIFYKGIFSTSLTSNVERAQWPLHNSLCVYDYGCEPCVASNNLAWSKLNA